MTPVSKASLLTLKNYLDKKENNPHHHRNYSPTDFEQIRATAFALAEHYKETDLRMNQDQFIQWGLDKSVTQSYHRRLSEMIEDYQKNNQLV